MTETQATTMLYLQSHPLSLFTILILVSLWLIRNFMSRRDVENRIRHHGGHGAIRRTFLPYGLDFVYNAITSAVTHQDLRFWYRQFRTYGSSQRPYTVEVQAAGRRVIYTADTDNIKAILTEQFSDYGKGSWLNNEWHDFFGDSILSTDGDKWQTGRKMMRNQLNRERISDLSCVEEHARLLLGRMKASVNTAKGIDVKDLFFRFTLDVSTHFLLGESVGSLRDLPNGLAFSRALDEVQRFLVVVAIAGKAGRILPRRTFRRNLKTVNEFVNTFVDRALSLTPEQLEKAEEDKSFNFLHTLARRSRDPTVLRDQLIAVLIGGRDTTATCLCWLFYSLAQNPSITAKLRQEILSTVGKDRAPDYQDIKSMEYLNNVIKETLRLYPSVPYNIRYALRDTSLPRGGGTDGSERIGVLKRTPIVYSIQYLHLTAEHYPNTAIEPSIFAPERWDDWIPKHWTYIPFNGGPRLCVGQQFALTEVAYTVIRILQGFKSMDWLEAGESVYAKSGPGKSVFGCSIENFLARQKMQMRNEIVLAPVGSMRIRFEQDAAETEMEVA